MHENSCLQCNRVSSGPSNRLVHDACGHKKCRSCLLADEEQCTQCQAEIGVKNGVNITKSDSVKCDRNGESFNDYVLNNHTAVIQVNGGVPNTAKSKKYKSTEKSTNVTSDKFQSIAGTSKEQSYVSDVEFDNEDISKSSLKRADKKQEKKSHSPIEIPTHITAVADPPSYHCTICGKTFITRNHVKYHSYCGRAVKPYKCEVCQKEFILRAQLDVHSYKHKSNKPFSCTICKKSFSARNKLTRHSSVHSVVRSHICSVCGNAYRSKESLKIHSVIHKGEKPYACKLCPAKFSNQSNLNKHGTTHSKEKAHMCDQCGKRFKQKWALSVHRRSHLRLRPHKCAVCLKAFVNLKDLQRHSLIHNDSKAYSCSICMLSFRRTDNLRRHMKNTHPGKIGEVIKNSANVATLLPNIHKKSPLDNPNAINVITSAAAPAVCKSKAEGAAQWPKPKALSLPPQSDCRPTLSSSSSSGRVNNSTVINGPLKLAFKTPAFKSSYNIHRDFDYVPTPQHPSSYDMVESVNIYQKIFSANSSRDSPPPRNIICIADLRGPTSEEICQKILDPNSEPKRIHYETSFQNRQHAMIKNIKFKVPIQYTSSFRESNSTETNLESNSATSVIVNSNSQSNIVEHWRRRTSQNLGLRN